MASKKNNNKNNKLYTMVTSLPNETPSSVSLMDQGTQKDMETLITHRDELERRIAWLYEVSKHIETVSSHPRVASRTQMSKFVEVDCLLNTSEYRLKHAEFSILSSLKMTASYCQKSIEDMEVELQKCNEQIDKITEQQLLAKGITVGKPIEVRSSENCVLTVYDTGVIDIVETDPRPYVRPVRTPRFKTCKERNKFLEDIRSQDNAESTTVLNCVYDMTSGLTGGFSEGDHHPLQKPESNCWECEEFTLYQKCKKYEAELQMQMDLLREILPLMNHNAIAFGVVLDNYHLEETAVDYNGIPFFQYINSTEECSEFANKMEEFAKSCNDIQKAIYFLIKDAECFLEKMDILSFEVDNFSHVRNQLKLMREYHFNQFMQTTMSEEDIGPEQDKNIQTSLRKNPSKPELIFYGQSVATDPSEESDTNIIKKCTSDSFITLPKALKVLRKKQIQKMKLKLKSFMDRLY